VVIVPIVHKPVTGSYVPCDGVAETKVRPAGKMSVAVTFVAAVGPLLVTVTVKVTVSPTLGVALLTVLLTARSACCGVSVALAELFAVSGSNWSASVIVAVLVCATALTTRACTVKVCGSAVVIVPIVHAPVAES
jgi:hypothetical protein